MGKLIAKKTKMEKAIILGNNMKNNKVLYTLDALI